MSGKTRISKPMYSAWTEEQINVLVCLIIKFSYPPQWTGKGPAKRNVNWSALAKRHNAKFNLNRTPDALSAMHRRLKECFTYSSYTEVWKLMNEYKPLFLPVEKTKIKEKVNRLLEVIEKQQDQMDQLMTLLDKNTTPSENHQKAAH